MNMKRILVLIFLTAPVRPAAPEARSLRGSFAGGYMYSYYVPPAASTPWRPSWSPDGEQIAFFMAGSIWRMRTGETAAYELTANRTYDSAPAWSPDGRWIAYTAEDEQSVKLMLLNLATGESAPLTSTGQLNLDPVWSPDGKRLAFVRNEPNREFHIYVMALAVPECNCSVSCITTGHCVPGSLSVPSRPVP
jgi:Tol biopolymer transport system component